MTAQVKAAKKAGIPVATVTETPVPPDTAFQDFVALVRPKGQHGETYSCLIIHSS